MPRDEATQVQIAAARPDRSTWLSANAGSGKTRVLTDRVARLLLDGTDPQLILCLTYTKAAASEMQNRLFKRLGEWAMLDDNELLAALGKLGGPAALDAETLSIAQDVDALGRFAAELPVQLNAPFTAMGNQARRHLGPIELGHLGRQGPTNVRVAARMVVPMVAHLVG